MVPYGSIKENRRVLLIENTHADRLLLRNWLTAERIEVYDAVDIITGLAGCSDGSSPTSSWCRSACPPGTATR